MLSVARAARGIRDFGACMAPFTAFQILQGIETLPLRMARHVDNARRIVILADHPFVSVGYSELPGHRTGSWPANCCARVWRGLFVRHRTRAGAQVDRNVDAVFAPATSAMRNRWSFTRPRRRISG